MHKVARLSESQRRELFAEAAARLGTTPAVVEKDFWVTWVLDRLFSDPALVRVLMFKGGTCLSKAYGLIERFSEDIDLVLDWRVLVGEDPLAELSRTQQEKLNEAINQQAQRYIREVLLGQVNQVLEGLCQGDIPEGEPHVIAVRYPAAFPDAYLRPEILLEIGPLASWLPHESRDIRPYAAEVFPRMFERGVCTVQVIKAERTFWEKATILHQEVYRPEDTPQPSRYSRHYYDLARMARSPVRAAALANPQLLADVVEFKQRFYPRAWARYDLARAGSLRLVPGEALLRRVAADYRAMENMIFGDTPSFDDILTTLRELEAEINGK